MTIKYIRCEEPGNFQYGTKELADGGPNDVRIKIKNIGICGTDLHAYAGNQPFFTYPRILGHELSGEILEIGQDVSLLKVGDRVLIMPYVSCTRCVACRAGKTNCCTSIQVLGVHTDGGMQEEIVLSQDLLMEINDLSFPEIAIVEPLAIGAHAVRRADLSKGDLAVVIGCGPIGLGIMKQAQLAGARVIAIDQVGSRLRFATEKLGIDHVINASLEDADDAVARITEGDLAGTVFDATGNRKALESGHQYMSHGGKYVLVGLFNGELTFHHPSLHAKEASVLCSRNATREDFTSVVEMLRAGVFPSSNYISHTVKFDKMIEEFESWLDPQNGVIKAMVSLD